MRILYLHQYFATPAVAAGTRSYEFCKRLIGAGHEVVMVTSTAFLPAPHNRICSVQSIHIDGIHVVVVPQKYSNEMTFRRRIYAFLSFAWKASCVRLPHNFDVVFATSTPLTIAIPGIVHKIRNCVPLVFEVRDLWPEMPIAMGVLRNPVACFLAQSLEWMAYRASRRIVALSPGMAEGVVRRGVNRSRITVIPNGCDLELFRVDPEVGRNFRKTFLGIDNETPALVYAGTFGHVNGIRYAIEVAKYLQQTGAKTKIILVGAGVEKEAIREMAQKYGVLGQTVQILDPLAKCEIPGLLSAATAMASLFIPVKEMWHNSANKFFDALAAAKPVVINYGGWQADLLKESGAGLVLDSYDHRKAAEQLEVFLTDAARLQSAAAAAAHLSETQFNRDELARRFIAVLEEASS